MADTDSTNHTTCKVGDALETIDTKLAQLQALLMMTFGEAQDSFDSMNDTLRGNFMWACHNLVEDCQSLLKTVTVRKEVSHG